MLSGPKHMKLFPETGELLPSGPLTEEDKISDALAEDLHATNTSTSEEKPLMSKSAAPHTEKSTTEAGDAYRMPAADRTASMRGLDIDLGKLPLQAALHEHAARKPSAQNLDNRHLGQSGKGEEEPPRHAESFKDTKHEMKMAKERKHSWTRAGQDGDYKYESPKTSAGGRRPELAVYKRGALEVFQAVKARTAGSLRAGTNVNEIQSETSQLTTSASIGKRKQSAGTLSQAKLLTKVDSDIGPSQQISTLSQQQGIALKRSSGTTVANLRKNERDGVMGSAEPALGTYGSLTSPQSPDYKIGSPDSKPSIVSPRSFTAGEHGTTAAGGPSPDQKRKMSKQEIIAQAKLKRAEERAKRSKKKKERTNSKDNKEKKQKARSKDKKKHRTKHGNQNEHIGRRDEVGYTTGKSTYIFCIILLGLSIAAAIVLFFLIKAFTGENVPSTSTGPSSSTTNTTSTRITPIYFCQSKYCTTEGSYIASLLSDNFKPCDNFYSYVCDAWSQRNPTDSRVTGTVVSRDTHFRDALAAQLISVLRSAKDEDLKSAAALHSSCTTRSEPETINALVKSMFGNWIIKEWPLKTRHGEQSSSVWRFAAELARDLGTGVLLEVSVGVITTAEPGQSIVELSTSALPVGRK
ncbi:hypothetical protein HPB48_018359 [Haemaphysalis longicornis]|uniref:Peptidase M13 N-terminal domain-containing protein n=1 Tax=Haemaphysalis longicornis TaxID=44386 RepID=A0A9J6GD55_HAELO|nr:hypothetical protein HPB48_018359 [Haemaphysalis longicornis]